MAKKRDVVIAVIIIGFFVIAIGMFGLMFLGLASQDDGLEFGGFGDGDLFLAGIDNNDQPREEIHVFDATQDYVIAFVFAGILCFLAGGCSVVVWGLARARDLEIPESVDEKETDVLASAAGQT